MINVLIVLCGLIFSTHCSEIETLHPANQTSQKEQALETSSVSLTFKDKSLNELVREIAQQKGINLFIPDDINLTEKVTIDYGRVYVPQAWNYLLTLLYASGYTIVKQATHTYTIVQLKKTVNEALPLYAHIQPIELPSSEDFIRYIYYFENLSLADQKSKANVEELFKGMLSGDAKYILDQTSNSVILTARASHIKNVMSILVPLDKTGMREDLSIIPLYHANAPAVVAILNQLIPGQDQAAAPAYGFPGQTATQPKFGYYFNESTKVAAIEKSNALVVIGGSDSVARVREFVLKYLDKPLESGSSVIHVKPLQFVDANDLATILLNVAQQDTGKAQSVAQKQIQDTLSRVKITAEPQQAAPQVTNQNGQTVSSSSPIIGGNNLIIAAQHEDWIILDKLIDELDIPQLQVALEVLVVELTINDQRLLGSQLRNPTIGLPQDFNWQSAQITQPWVNFIPPNGGGSPSASVINTTRGIAADLLQMTNPANFITNGFNTTLNPVNIPLLAQAGTSVISINDGKGIAGILEVLEAYGNATILSQPFLITKNHTSASTTIQETRLVQGSVQQQSTGGPAILPEDNIAASLLVQLVPRISRSNNINLEITVTSNSFVTTDLTNNTINLRQVVTNANIGNKEVLVLGGLTKDTKSDSMNDFPILGSIPIVGYFFKNKQRTASKTTLMIFIQPTIIQPRLGGGIDGFTKRKLDYIKRQEIISDIGVEGAPFENLKDPITRVFFPSMAPEVNAQVDTYAQTGVYGRLKERNCFDVEPCMLEEADERSAKIKEMTKDLCNPLKK